MSRIRLFSLAILAALWACPLVQATDAPHNTTKGISCTSCHKTHAALGGALTTVAGNNNLCLSCHVTGGLGAGTGTNLNGYAFTAADQAVPTTGMPTGVAAAATSHRWDSSAAGRIALPAGQVNTSTATPTSIGAYTGPYAKTYLIQITTAGSETTAKYSYTPTTTTGAWGTAVLNQPASPTGTLIELGVSLKFPVGTYVSGDKWYLHVRHDIATPTSASLRLENGRMMCSSCHDQHLQTNPAFDPASRALAAGSAGRHFQRLANDTDQMCKDCHAPRNVTAKGGTSHPLGSLAITATAGDWKVPTTAILDASSKVQCQSCHNIHKAPTANGLLLRAETTANALCNDCHTYATATTKGIHFDATVGVIWPGPEAHTLGGVTIPATTYAAKTATDRGSCANCHATHGWPDSADTTKHYPHVLVENPSSLCLTCHDATPQTGATNVEAEIVKTNHHPVERASGRTVACADCHNPHKAVATPSAAADSKSHKYLTTASSTRNQILTAVTGPLVGADGVAPTFGAMWAAPSAYTAKTTATYEYEVCFKCHTSYDSYGATRPGGITNYYSTGTAKFTPGGTSVTGTSTVWTAAMVGMYIQRNIASPAYRITGFTNGTTITITPAYAGTDTTAAAYTITKQQTDLAVEFNPANRSGHPVTTGLNNYTGSIAPRALTVTLNAPWNTNKGTQTMMCSDCHNTDGAAAQGPHGSAAQFMLKGANAANWPNVTLTNRATSWCNNCHALGSSTNLVHTTGDHASQPCYACHILIPHGGKISRLIGNRNTMPVRYAYQNTLTNMQLTNFKKAASGSYQKGNCSAACDTSTHGTVTGGEGNW